VKVVKEILNQYCEIWSSSEAQQHFVEDDLGIPSEWLHEALVRLLLGSLALHLVSVRVYLISVICFHSGFSSLLTM